MRGEFCTGGARCGSCWESCVVLSRSLCAGWWAYGSALALLMGTAAGLSGSSGAPHAGGAGSLMGSALEGLRLHARKSSPCVAVRSRKREKVLPARSNWPKFGVFMRAGRTFSRKSRRRDRAGRTFSRKCHWRGGVGRTFSRQPVLRPDSPCHWRSPDRWPAGVLHYTKPSCGVSPACRTPV